jgi:hypothetical protein
MTGRTMKFLEPCEMITKWIYALCAISAFTLPALSRADSQEQLEKTPGQFSQTTHVIKKTRVSQKRALAAKGRQLTLHDLALQQSLAISENDAYAAVSSTIAAKKKLVVAVAPVQDKYGDPMYTYYGPLIPEPGTPEYDGPRYGASFSRGYLQPVPDAEYRGYARGAFSNPIVQAQTDVGLGTGTNFSYLQQGMAEAPGMMPASPARVMINNHP